MHIILIQEKLVSFDSVRPVRSKWTVLISHIVAVRLIWNIVQVYYFLQKKKVFSWHHEVSWEYCGVADFTWRQRKNLTKNVSVHLKIFWEYLVFNHRIVQETTGTEVTSPDNI